MHALSKLPRAILQHRRRIVQQEHGSQANGHNDAEEGDNL
ncbi:hypothetical protein Mal52_51020 [Symmachiella dynata]|uniref:Uncharacterized protein n=1 Tax=Symmachiella dynata TaxID=2527995 RepID=A0A517ZVV3_9PLAN|nr:hypothetical protein Mal52_51020 [Symmachiella dynata]